MQHEILIVDDDPVAIEVLRDNLAGEGYLIHTATEWTGMNRVIFARTISVLILDINLPGLKGDTLAGIVTRNLSIPPSIVLHSGLPENVLRRLTREVSATNCIPKGTSAEQVRQIVKAAASSFGRHLEAVKAADSSPPEGEPGGNPSRGTSGSPRDPGPGGGRSALPPDWGA